MKYNQYIVKKRFKGNAIGGYMNIPYGTICKVIGDFICHEGDQVCVTTSQNALDYFWGYDPSNPEKEIERQKLARALYGSAPKEDGDALADKSNPWSKYGMLVEYGLGMCIWQWDKSVLDLPVLTLQYLLNCIDRGEKPE